MAQFLSWRHSKFPMVKSRTSKELRRRMAFKSPKKAELIVCEGSSTEPAYFNALIRELRLHAVKVRVMSPEDSEPINIVDRAIAEKRQGVAPGIPYNKIWCVIDVEVPPHRTLGNAWEKAANVNGLDLILTNPFFEYWFLLHFKKVTTPFNKDKDLHDMLKEVHPSYRKTHIGFDNLYPLTETAIKNSKEVLKEKHCSDDLRDCNPSTHVHLIVEHLQKISERPMCRVTPTRRL